MHLTAGWKISRLSLVKLGRRTSPGKSATSPAILLWSRSFEAVATNLKKATVNPSAEKRRTPSNWIEQKTGKMVLPIRQTYLHI